MTVIRVTDCISRCLEQSGMDFLYKIQVTGSERFIGGFQSVSVIYIESLKLQAGRLPQLYVVLWGLRSHVTGPMTDPG